MQEERRVCKGQEGRMLVSLVGEGDREDMGWGIRDKENVGGE